MAKKIKIVRKPWGLERWLIVTNKYALKVLEIHKYHKFSLQYHRYKVESWYMTRGKLRVTLGRKKFIMKPGDVVHVPKRMVHRLEALQNSSLIEVSTPQLKDVVRIEDDYNRI